MRADQGPPPPEPPTGFIATSSTLFPAFSTDIPDYVAKCDSSAPILITVDEPDGTSVSIKGMPFQGGLPTKLAHPVLGCLLAGGPRRVSPR